MSLNSCKLLAAFEKVCFYVTHANPHAIEIDRYKQLTNQWCHSRRSLCELELETFSPRCLTLKYSMNAFRNNICYLINNIYTYNLEVLVASNCCNPYHPIGTKCIILLMDLFLYEYGSLVVNIDIYAVRKFHLSNRYIDDVLALHDTDLKKYEHRRATRVLNKTKRIFSRSW
jgi:hypothetical protein